MFLLLTCNITLIHKYTLVFCDNKMNYKSQQSFLHALSYKIINSTWNFCPPMTRLSVVRQHTPINLQLSFRTSATDWLHMFVMIPHGDQHFNFWLISTMAVWELLGWAGAMASARHVHWSTVFLPIDIVGMTVTKEKLN